jgi:tetratricopeptide (TPR) repeat protein
MHWCSCLFPGLGSWEEAAGYFRKATLIAPGFSFAAANYALAEYQIGKRNEAVKAFRFVHCVVFSCYEGQIFCSKIQKIP